MMKRKTTADRRQYKTNMSYRYRLNRQREEFKQMYDDVHDYIAFRFVRMVL